MHWAFKPSERPIEIVNSLYYTDLEDLCKRAETFDQQLRSSSQDLQDTFLALRRAFKKVEYILDYLQPQDVKDHINGAPLPKTERNAPRLIVLEPKGLQRMEELVFEAEPDLVELKKLSKEFNYQLNQMRRFAQQIQLDDRQLFEAVRLGLVRIMSLGITGFDTPASDQALIESAISWESMMRAMQAYYDQASDKGLTASIEKHFQSGLEALRGSNFDDFDRGTFIREHLSPLYGEILKLHLHIGYETAREVFRGELPFNYESEAIFSKDFLNLSYYTGMEMNDESIKHKKELGRLLFFDPVLSGAMDRSCASCHKPEKAYSDGLAKSTAKGGGTVDRNAPGLYNTLYSEKFFYDLRADRMETQMEHVIFSDKEFDTDYRTIFRRLKSSSEYTELFKKAFPERGGRITRYTLSQAIVAFLSELHSFNSRVDRYLRGEEVKLSSSEQKGLNLFMGKAACATCHFAPTFSGLVPPWFEENESEVLGVLTGPEERSLDLDKGRIASGVVADEASFFENSFKTVSIRNVEFTAPYFHNGAYETLDEVLEFYNHGGALGLGLDLAHQTLPGDSLELDESEIRALKDFMLALSDTSTVIQAPETLPSQR